MKRLWVIECQFNEGQWGICDFASRPYVSTNYLTAHIRKRDIQEYLQKHGSKLWYKNRFRVKEYKHKELI